MTTLPTLGIVVPTLDEETRLPRLLDDLRALHVPNQVVVVDGGSNDATVDLAKRAGARVVRSTRGRAQQMNAGAAVVDTPWLLFLHADSRLDHEAAVALTAWLESSEVQDIGVFHFALEGPDWFWRFIEVGQRLRQRLYRLAYGDQGLLVHRDRFMAVGGFPEQPLMEDVEILKRLKRGGRLRVIDARLKTSPRRYETDGRWFGWIRNAAAIGLYQMGIPAARLAAWYATPTRLGSADARRRALVIFAKAPRPGAVKTRLARDVGHQRAAEIYRRMGAEIVSAVRDGPYDTIVCFDPPDAEAEMRTWLDDAEADSVLRFRPQAEGDLGTRLIEAVRDAFHQADHVCVIGTDAPAVDANVVASGFRALETANCVIGPATDGGYYLIGLTRSHPQVFERIDWSTPKVLAQTLDRAAALGLSVETLSPLSDVDVFHDLPLELRG